MAREITITLTGEDGHVNANVLIEALENTLNILRGIEVYHPLKEQLRWEVVRASMNSPLKLTLSPQLPESKVRKVRDQYERSVDRIIDTFGRGLRPGLSVAEVPDEFDDDTLKVAARLAKGVSDSFTKLKIYFEEEDQSFEPSVDTIQRMQQALTKVKTHYEIGTIEGKLEIVSTHGRESFFVFEAFTDFKVECYGSHDDFDKATEFMKHHDRVAVAGKIKYTHGRPKTIRVSELRRLRSKGELPQPRDMEAINITDGMLPEDYIRSVRNARR